MTASPARSFDGYLVERELARGGMGAIYQVLDPRTGVRYALKTLLPGERDPQLLARFRREAELLARVRHPHVVAIHAAALDRDPPYLVQALVEGGSLQARLEREGALPAPEALRLTLALAGALEAAHAAGVLHRDLKPHNVLLDPRGEPVLVDFGLARAPGERGGQGALTRTGELVGTPAYVAPEQVDDARAVDARADVYGLGATLYALLSGQPPFRGTSVILVLRQVLEEPPAPDPRIPAALRQVLARALAKRPEERYPDAASFAQALRQAQATPGAPAGGRAVWLALLGAGVAAAGLLGLLVVSRAPAASAPASAPTPAPAASTSAQEAALQPALDLPAWWEQVPASERPPLPLPEGLAWGQAAREVVNARDGSALCWVPPGRFEMGAPPQGSRERMQPRHPVTLSAGFFLGKYELDCGRYRAFCAATGHAPPLAWLSARDDFPVTGVTWADAQAYCAWAGLRLPREAEWEYAAAGGAENRPFPWGHEDPDPTRAHLDWVGDDGRGAVAVDSFPLGAGRFGQLNLIGNVAEWTEDGLRPYDERAQQDPLGPVGPLKQKRGASFKDGGTRGTARVYRRETPQVDGPNQHTGFRVAR